MLSSPPPSTTWSSCISSVSMFLKLAVYTPKSPVARSCSTTSYSYLVSGVAIWIWYYSNSSFNKVLFWKSSFFDGGAPAAAADGLFDNFFFFWATVFVLFNTLPVGYPCYWLRSYFVVVFGILVFRTTGFIRLSLNFFEVF